MIFLGAEEVESGLIVKQARDLGITAVRRGRAAGHAGVPDTAGAANVEGTIVSSPYLSNDISEAAKKFAAAYKAAYSEDAELHGAKAYDGAQIMLTALKTSNAAPARRSPTRSAPPSTRGCSATSPSTRPASASSPPRSASSPEREARAGQSNRAASRAPVGTGEPCSLSADAHRRAEPRRRLRPGRPGLLAGLPHDGPGQLRARQRGDDRRVRRVHLLPVRQAAVRGGDAGRHRGDRR